MKLIQNSKENINDCPHYQNLCDKGEYSYGADFSDSIVKRASEAISKYWVE